jgi:hypothetical protein
MNIMHGMNDIKTLSECYYILLHNQTFHDSREFIAEYRQSTSAAIHLSANRTMQYAVTQSKPILIQTVNTT